MAASTISFTFKPRATLAESASFLRLVEYLGARVVGTTDNRIVTYEVRTARKAWAVSAFEEDIARALVIRDLLKEE